MNHISKGEKKMEKLVIRVDLERRKWWRKTIQELLPDLQIVLLDEDSYDPQTISYAIVWNPPLGMFQEFPNLRCVASVGAGVSHILKDKAYPKDVPIIRCVNERLRLRMAEYIALHVLRFHRGLPEVEEAHAGRNWGQYIAPLANEINVGILGIGSFGSFAAKKLLALGYSVLGFSRRKKEIEGVMTYSGDKQFYEFLSKVNILVCLLPQTPLTEDILCKRTLNALPDNSYLINIGRGECLVEDDLIDALNSKKLNRATLDVFRQEPLPTNHPFWSHPKVLVTCHSAGVIDPAIGGVTIANNIKAFIRGDHIPDIVDIEQGY